MNIRALFFCIFSFFSVYAFSADMAKPKAGEGIYRFLLNNGRNPATQSDAFIELNKSKLGKNNMLIKDVAYILPPLPTKTAGLNPTKSADLNSTQSTELDPSQSNDLNSTPQKNQKREPLFGKKYEYYTVNSNKLQGATFFLVSGHGGPDCGAIGKADGIDIHEDEYAYDIMLRLARYLLMEGATVHIIIQDKYDGIRDEKFLKNNKKETCRGKTIPLNQVKRLQQRCDEINELSRKSKDKYQRAIFIHLDSRSVNKQMDVFFYHHSTSPTGKKLALTMQQTLKTQYRKHQPNRVFTGTVSPRDLYVLSNSNTVGLYAELGNIRNSFDQKRFLLSSNRDYLAHWLSLGFIADYQNNKK